MKITWKALLALFFYTLGVVGWFYVGGWMILRGPVRGVILAHMAGDYPLYYDAVNEKGVGMAGLNFVGTGGRRLVYRLYVERSFPER